MNTLIYKSYTTERAMKEVSDTTSRILNADMQALYLLTNSDFHTDVTIFFFSLSLIIPNNQMAGKMLAVGNKHAPTGE